MLQEVILLFIHYCLVHESPILLTRKHYQLLSLQYIQCVYTYLKNKSKSCPKITKW